MSAALHAVTVDMFTNHTTHAVRRLIDPYIHRGVQSTNDNFKLLFVRGAAQWSLAPLSTDEQMHLIDDAVREHPLRLSTLDMENYGFDHNLDPAFSTEAAQLETGIFGWRWHYRALTVQSLFEVLIMCHLDANGYVDDTTLQDDTVVSSWWTKLVDKLPALKRSISQDIQWSGGGIVTRMGLIHVLRTLMVWMSWIHEDVGHSTAAYVYNPIHTPMQVPSDGEGIPLHPHLFNNIAYRTFVFLNRAKLLDPPPNFWFSETTRDKQCFVDFQVSFAGLAQKPMFSDCGKTGFYSCMSQVETSVSS
jgi:hypothetical protein